MIDSLAISAAALIPCLFAPPIVVENVDNVMVEMEFVRFLTLLVKIVVMRKEENVFCLLLLVAKKPSIIVD